MTVDELIKELQRQDPGRLVVIYQHNGAKKLAGFDVMNFEEEHNEWGEVGFEELTPALRSQGYTEEDLRPDGEPALMLWTN